MELRQRNGSPNRQSKKLELTSNYLHLFPGLFNRIHRTSLKRDDNYPTKNLLSLQTKETHTLQNSKMTPYRSSHNIHILSGCLPNSG